MKVAPDLSVPGAPNIFVIGDLAAVERPSGVLVPGVAPAAQQEGRHAVRMIRADLQRRPRAPFRYLDKGALATIGRAAAVAEIGNLRTEGLFAWLLWLVVHIMTLIGFRNRFRVLAEWAFAYLRFERGARLITGEIAGGSAHPSLSPAGDVWDAKEMRGTPTVGTPGAIGLTPTPADRPAPR